MNTPTVLVNSYEVRKLTGLKNSKLKYHRINGHIKGYQLKGQRQWFFRADQINRLFVENIRATGQNVPKLDMISSSININGGTNS